MADEITQTPPPVEAEPLPQEPAPNPAPVINPIADTPGETQGPHVPFKVLTILEVAVAVVLVGGSFWWWMDNRPPSTSSNFVPTENSREAEEIYNESTEEDIVVEENSDLEINPFDGSDNPIEEAYQNPFE